ERAAILSWPQETPLDVWRPNRAPGSGDRTVTVRLAVKDGERQTGVIELAAQTPQDTARQLAQIDKYTGEWNQIKGAVKSFRIFYTMLMVLITLFVLFVATWLARILANRISIPITALLDAAVEVRKGNLQHRVTVRAEDELGQLVRGFNEMTEGLESSAQELDR